MLVWSLAATLLYFHARSIGAPDLLVIRTPTLKRSCLATALVEAATSLSRIWMAGLPAIIFTHLLHRQEQAGWAASNTAGRATLGAGATLFGVTTTHHVLQGAGYRGSRLLQLSCLASVPNVFCRVLVGAASLGLLAQFARLVNLA
jgi:hypothetical protein